MPNSNLKLSSEVKYLKGVGPVRAELFASRGISTVKDLLYHTPFRYEDRTRITRVRDLVPGQSTTVLVRVLTCGLMRTRKGVYIYDLGVLEDHRRKGIATELVQMLKQVAKEIGAYIIFVQADKPDVAAIRLYESLGKAEDVLNFDIVVD